MALELHVAGPGLESTRRLSPGDPALILGRDPECTVCLADPERSISRRHLSLWNDGEQLHFHVLSTVNGVDHPAGEVPPGGRGILHVGETLQLSAYRISVSVLSGDAPPADPWELLERVAATTAAAARGEGDALDTVAASPEDDPFGDWGFGSSFVSLSHVATNNNGRTLPFTVDERRDLQLLWNAACTSLGGTVGGDGFCPVAGTGYANAKNTRPVPRKLTSSGGSECAPKTRSPSSGLGEASATPQRPRGAPPAAGTQATRTDSSTMPRSSSRSASGMFSDGVM